MLVFAIRGVTSLCTKLNSGQIFIALVLGHMAYFDTMHVKNRRELQAELQVFTALKERPIILNWELERTKTEELKCYSKLRHEKEDCRCGMGF